VCLRDCVSNVLGAWWYKSTGALEIQMNESNASGPGASCVVRCIGYGKSTFGVLGEPFRFLQLNGTQKPGRRTMQEKDYTSHRICIMQTAGKGGLCRLRPRGCNPRYPVHSRCI